MHSSELAPNIDAITRQYISLAIQEALTPSLTEVWDAIERAKATAPKAPDTAAIESKLEHTIADKLAAQLTDLVSRNIAAIREELTNSLSSLADDITSTETRIATLRTIIDAVDDRLSSYVNADRYSITRAHVIKAMREANG